MTTPLPSAQADRLLFHMEQCMACRWAKLSPNPTANFCAEARKLIQLTTKERHG